MKNSPYSRHKDFRDEVEVAAAAWFKVRGYQVNSRSPYILRERKNWRKNIILPSVSDLIGGLKEEHEEAGESFPLHRFIHHGLSSQALLFNLVGPLIIDDDLNAMRDAFPDTAWPEGDLKGEFEGYDRTVFNEKQAQPTSIDFVIRGASNRRTLFIEAKFVENEFGGCSIFSDGDCAGRNPAQDFSLCYLHESRQRLYWECLRDYGFLNGSMIEGPFCALANHYQFFRELLFALVKGGHFVLLFDERNPAFFTSGTGMYRGLMPLLTSFVPYDLETRVIFVTIQGVVASIKKSGRHQYWISDFEAKYGLDSQ